MPKAKPLALALALLAASMTAREFRTAAPGYEFTFPRDHGSHDDYRTEWWYYSGHLRTGSGRRYGFELTFFRVGVTPPDTPSTTRWDLRHLSLAHFAVTDVNGKRFRYYEKLNRSSPFTAGAASGFLHVFNEGWSVTTARDGSWRLTASAGGDAIDLTLRPRKPPAIHGENGISVKAEGAGYASHYYSMTRLDAEGSIAAGGRPRERCSGSAWMDHEFGSALLRETQQGWDWFSLQFDNETELMLYVMRRRDGTADVTSSGSLVTPEGNVIAIRHDQIRIRPLRRWKSPRSGGVYPMGWKIEVASLDLAVTLQPLLDDQELRTPASTRVTYWEGAVDAAGSMGNTVVRGRGYVEMTGYAPRGAE
ncbi:MAG TPA: lipocalin-like domain-containing protein [Thermoanaerobaculia bacterium]|nr:lipocalin-like domain-containing protein [Thermoanaerobaculia bacterium]